MNIAQKGPMKCYLSALYLNQGHSFFAPDVGPGHIMRYELFDQSNRPLRNGSIPDREKHASRLFYHRHLMLADQAELPTPEFRQRNLQAYARHLLRVNRDAHSARVTLLAHWPLPTDYLKEGRPNGYARLMRDISQSSGRNAQIDADGFETIDQAIQRRSDLGPEDNLDTQSSTRDPRLNWQNNHPNVARGWSGGAPR
jgi:hypothetical protein